MSHNGKVAKRYLHLNCVPRKEPTIGFHINTTGCIDAQKNKKSSPKTIYCQTICFYPHHHGRSIQLLCSFHLVVLPWYDIHRQAHTPHTHTHIYIFIFFVKVNIWYANSYTGNNSQLRKRCSWNKRYFLRCKKAPPDESRIQNLRLHAR